MSSCPLQLAILGEPDLTTRAFPNGVLQPDHFEATFLPTGDVTRCPESARPGIDLVVLCLGEGEGNAEAKVAAVRRDLPQAPLLVVVDTVDDAAPGKVIRWGAHDGLLLEECSARGFERAVHRARARFACETESRIRGEFFRLISENVTDLIAVLDRDGRRLYNSPSYRFTLGREAMAGTDSFAEIHPDDKARVQQLFQESLATGVGQRTEYRMVLGDGSVRHIESIGSVIRDECGQPHRVVVVARDVTERRAAVEQLERTLEELRAAHEALQRAQQRILESSKLEAVSTLAGAIAHEVKNPLQTILLGIDFFRGDEPSTDPNVTMVLTEMETAARKADAVIRGLLEFAAYRQHEMGQHSLNEIVRGALEAVQPELAAQRRRVELDLAGSLPPLRLDERKVRHVLLKLILTAAQALPPEAILRVHTLLREEPAETADGAPARSVIVQFVGEGEGFNKLAAASEGRRAFGAPGVSSLAFDLMVVQKVVEFFGGSVQAGRTANGQPCVSVAFRT